MSKRDLQGFGTVRHQSLLKCCLLRLSVTEASRTTNSDSYTVTLNTQPAGNVRIDVVNVHKSVDGVAAATVSPPTLIVTPSDWNSGQMVTVTSVEDFVAQSGDHRVTMVDHFLKLRFSLLF